MSFSDSFFAVKFGIARRDLEAHLTEALGRGGDYADLYFEYLATSSISIDESIVKSATQGVSLGVGVRVIAGERTGYAYSDDLSPEKIRHAAQVAALIDDFTLEPGGQDADLTITMRTGDLAEARTAAEAIAARLAPRLRRGLAFRLA